MADDVVLETTRLQMRPLTRAHLPDLQALYRDERVTRFLVALDEAGHLRRLQESEDMWRSRNFGRVAMFEKSTGEFVGRGGLQHWPQFDEVEVGWVLRSDRWGRGYAVESARAWIDWAFRHLDLDYVTAYIDPGNHASISVAERLGMSVLRTDTFHGRAALAFAAHRPLVE